MIIKQTLIGLFIASLSTSVINAQNKSINFETSSFEEIKAKAKKENKMVFIDAYTTWCGPCKWMAKNTFTNDTVADYFNSNFISAKIDMEKGEGVEISKKYEVRCFPNLLFLNAKGEIVHRVGGALDAKGLIDLAKTAQGSSNTYQYYQTNYASQKNNPEFLANYIDYLGTTCLSTESLLKEYFATQKESDYTSRRNWEIIKEHTQSFKSDEFNFLTKNYALFSEKYSSDSVNAKIEQVVSGQARRYIYAKEYNAEKLNEFKKEIAALNLPNNGQIMFYLNLENYMAREDWKNFGNVIMSEGDQFLRKSNYNDVSWAIYQHIDDNSIVEKASKWMESILDNNQKNDLYAEYDTFASLLYKLKKKDSALSAANKALDFAKKMGYPEADYSGTLELIKKINAL